MTPYVVVWAALALVVLALAVWRQIIDIHEDDSIHLRENQAGLVTEQVSLAHKVRAIDRLGKTLTVVVLLYGIALAGWVVYLQWIESSKLPG